MTTISASYRSFLHELLVGLNHIQMWLGVFQCVTPNFLISLHSALGITILGIAIAVAACILVTITVLALLVIVIAAVTVNLTILH